MPEPTLRARLAAVLRKAAFLCDGCCDLADEAACDAAHPIQPTVLHFGVVADIAGPVDAIAEAVMGEVQGDVDRLQERAEKAEAELAGARATIDHMSNAMSWIAGHDRQGLDHLEEAQYEAHAREAAVVQARRWAVRARAAEAALAPVRAVESDDLHGWYAAMDDDAPTPAAEDVIVMPCFSTLMRRFGGEPMHPHSAHDWAPQPGMTPVRCPGTTTTQES
ncbi:hypothetical protein [Streptacidiphilus carbonis]|uniref:hypothetical protein n=1 Tax=Streptacidiphilus carbonis TaxID=105422 RepID=UPI000693A022|nr:hypothetical protein [Streptacidiphilus carbonis]